MFSRRHSLYLGLVIGVALLILAGTLSMFWVKKQVETGIRDELIRTVDVAVAAVDPRSFEKLSYSEADMTDPVFLDLQKQFVRLGDVFKTRGIRWIYAVKTFDDAVRIAMDSIPLDDPEHSDPGIVYAKPPAAISDVMRDGQARFTGPYTDEYGSYFSVFAPIKDQADGRIVALMAADVDTAHYQALVSRRQRLPLLATVLGGVLFAVSYLFWAQRSEKKRAIRAREMDRMKHAKEREAMLLNIREGVVACDLDGRVAFVNRFAADLIGVPSSGCLGRPYRDLWLFRDARGRVVADDGQPLVQAFADSQPRSYPLAAHYHLARPDGGSVPVTASVAPVVLEGKLVGVVLAISDVRQEAEIDRMKTEFISIASHQLRSPLTAIKFSAAMLLDGSYGDISPQTRTAVAQIADVTERMFETVEVLLDVSRIEAGKLTVVPEPTDLGALAAAMVTENGFSAQAKEQDVRLEIQPDLPRINVDPKLISEVYKNLLTNAIKYTPDKGRIEISVKVEGQDILSCVRDNGYGIPKKDHDRVYRKFYRGDNIVNLPKTTGTGLGLYCVKMLVETSGGRLWFESAEGKGTTFYFTLPLAGSRPKDAGTDCLKDADRSGSCP